MYYLIWFYSIVLYSTLLSCPLVCPQPRSGRPTQRTWSVSPRWEIVWAATISSITDRRTGAMSTGRWGTGHRAWCSTPVCCTQPEESQPLLSAVTHASPTRRRACSRVTCAAGSAFRAKRTSTCWMSSPVRTADSVSGPWPTWAAATSYRRTTSAGQMLGRSARWPSPAWECCAPWRWRSSSCGTTTHLWWRPADENCLISCSWASCCATPWRSSTSLSPRRPSVPCVASAWAPPLPCATLPCWPRPIALPESLAASGTVPSGHGSSVPVLKWPFVQLSSRPSCWWH